MERRLGLKKFVFCLLAGLPILARGAIIYVPDQYLTIQEGIGASQAGDTVLVRPGIYAESIIVPEWELTLAGQHLLSSDTADIGATVIRPPMDSLRCLYAVTPSQVVRLTLHGLTFRGGVHTGEIRSGGLEIILRDLRIRYCVLDSSFWWQGGALLAIGGTVAITDTRIRTVGCWSYGTAIEIRGAESRISRTEFSDDFTPDGSRANLIRVDRGSLLLENCSLYRIGRARRTGHMIVDSDHGASPMTVVGCRISQCRIHTFFDAAREHVAFRFDSNTVQACEFFYDLFTTDNVDSGTCFHARANVFLDNREIDDPTVGGKMFFSVWRPNVEVRITGNLFARNHNHEYSCIGIGHVRWPDVEVARNYILENSASAIANPPGGVCVLTDVAPGTFYHNVIVGNRGYAAFNGPFPDGFAFWNYWGHSSGPYHPEENPGGQGDTVETGIYFDPWEPDTNFLHSTRQDRLPTDFVIGRAFPNPFNSEVTIEFAGTQFLRMKLEVFDVLGRKVDTVYEGIRGPGICTAKWNANGHASGLYFARLSAEGSRQPPYLQKLVLLK